MMTPFVASEVSPPHPPPPPPLQLSRLPQMKNLLAGYWGLNIASKKTPSKPVTCFVFVVISVYDETYKRSHGLSSQAFH